MTDRPRERRGLHVVNDGPLHDLTLPRDNDAERAILGACLISRAAIDTATQRITATDFHDRRHELIFAAIEHRYARLENVDQISICDDLRTELPRLGGQAFIYDLVMAPGALEGNTDNHAQIVARLAAKRRLAQAHLRGLQRALDTADADTTPDELLDAARGDLDTIPTTAPGVDGTTPTNTWAPVDFNAVLNDDLTTPKASILHRRDGKSLLYPYAVHSISGEPGSLKTWVALLAIAQELEAGNNAALIDFEDRAQSVAARLLQIGVNPDHLRDPTRWRYVRPDAALDPAGTTALDDAVADCTIAVIDGVTEAMSLHGWSINDNDDVAAYVTKLPRRIADRGPAVLQVDHVTKDSDTRGRYAIGGQHKLASITGTAMKALVVKSGGRGEHGVIKVVLDKDKHGDVGPSGHTIGEFHLDDTQDGQTFAWLDHPTASVDDEGHFRPTVLMGRVSDYLAAHGGSSGAAIRSGVKGKNESIAEAVEALIREGHIRTEPAPRGGVFHYLVTPFEDAS